MSHPLSFGGGPVEVFYGGPGLDNVADISIFIGDLPGYKIYFGMDCIGVGDMNGDDVDDFAFSSVIGSGYAAVFVFAGSVDPTDVEEVYPGLLPDEFELHQKYPNPFKSSNTIEFDLKRRARIRLEIFNILGEAVATLADVTLSPGKHVYQWHGHDTGGEPVSSGVYLYRLKTSDMSITRKMVLMK